MTGLSPSSDAQHRNWVYVPGLDGIRAVAFLLVFVSHAGFDHLIPGGFGVSVFFFLSGFLITSLLRWEHEQTGRIDFKAFYIRRMIRILPAFYVVLALGAGLTIRGILPGEISLMPFLSQVLHVANYHSIFFGNDGKAIGSGVYWSLAVEEHFYLFFPFLLAWTMRRGWSHAGNAACFGCLCIWVLLWRCHLVFAHGMGENRVFFATDTRIDNILYGCALGVFCNPILDHPVGSNRLWLWGLLPSGCALLAVTLLYRDPAFRESFRYTMQGLGLIPCFVVAMRFPSWWPARLLTLPLMRWLGKVSYSMYLVHYTIIARLMEFEAFSNPWVLLSSGFLITLAVASAVYYGVERPMILWRLRNFR